MLLALLLATSPIEQTPYWGCLEHNVARLEVSGERPRDVAYAAIDACHSKEPTGLNPRLMEKIREKLVPKLAARVVEIRASRR